jgi:hypothetical protein
MSSQDLSFELLVAIAAAEYREMPGLRLTRAQAQRLWGLDCPRCADAVLDALIVMKVVRQTRDGMFARVMES